MSNLLNLMFMFEMIRSGFKNIEISNKYNVIKNHVSYTLGGAHWSHIYEEQKTMGLNVREISPMPVIKSFGSYVDKRKRDSLKELKLVEKLLKKQGLKVENFLENKDGEDSYLFCHSPIKHGSFEGIRIYKIAEKIAFRVQKESETHPYGRAYPLPIEEMFQDFLEDENISEEKAGKKVIEAVVREIRKFFEKSVEIEKDQRNSSSEDGAESQGAVSIRQSGQDYSNLVYTSS